MLELNLKAEHCESPSEKFAVIDIDNCVSNCGVAARALLARPRYVDHDSIGELSESFDDHASDYRHAADHEVPRRVAAQRVPRRRTQREPWQHAELIACSTRNSCS